MVDSSASARVEVNRTRLQSKLRFYKSSFAYRDPQSQEQESSSFASQIRSAYSHLGRVIFAHARPIIDRCWPFAPERSANQNAFNFNSQRMETLECATDRKASLAGIQVAVRCVKLWNCELNFPLIEVTYDAYSKRFFQRRLGD